VVLAGRNPEALERAAAELRGRGAGDVHAVDFDALAPETHLQVIARAADLADGNIDVVVVAVGVLGDPTTDEYNPVAAANVGATNYVGAMSASLAASDHLRRQGHGTIVILSSVAGVRVRRSNFIYGSSKAAIDGFALGLADSLHGSGVRVVIVRPGFVRTKMTAARDVVPLSTSPQAVARATVAGIRAGREVVWVPPLFQLLFALFAHLPRSLWRRLPL
jgi:decaprenylphospho-beta-D-erythro-pentofuranosid-2-ulose 2-reductase